MENITYRNASEPKTSTPMIASSASQKALCFDQLATTSGTMDSHSGSPVLIFSKPQGWNN